SSFAFDSSVAGLFWTLSQGGYLCLPNDQQSKDPQCLGELIAEHAISHLLALPSLYALLLTQAATQLSSLTTAIVAGEACTTDIVKQHYALLPNVPLYNEYGPTENSVWSSVYLTNREELKQAVSIGHPISRVKIYLLNNAYTPVPIGVTGEIYVGGEGIVRGYLNRPDLTAEKFIPDPFSESGQRLYKTGDLAKYRPDGSIEFLGRVDHQVKIRGFRIEFKNTLPDYMLPTAFIFLDALPLTANGKLNRNALPQADFRSPKLVLDSDAPSTEIEKTLAAIWIERLELETIGIHDDFFALGGHSLLATQLLFAVRNALNLTSSQLTLKQFFDRPTIAAQAKIITGEVDESAANELNLANEVQLPAALLPIASQLIEAAQAEAIFLTGATGFLGAFLLVEILEHSAATVYCLIRAANETQAMQRLQQQLQRFELVDRVDCNRIIAVCGDLAEPQLGLTPARYTEIAQRVSVIYHNGALVNFIQPYAMLKPANVAGSQEVLRLACTRTAKAIHYVSTLSVFSATTPPHALGFAEHDEAELTDNLDNGYAQTKWVAEQIMQLASRRGFQVSIYRPATVAGDSINGVWNNDDFLCRLLKGCLQLGYAPQDNPRIELAPVDYIAKAIVKLSQQADSIGGVFHLNSPHATYTQEVLNWFHQAGYEFERVTHAQWVKKLLNNAEHIENFALAPLLALFTEHDEVEPAHCYWYAMPNR
ncbi:MAG: non-ribosomal peptide synthetase, partial [Methylococcaceae bacterium NSP1-2]